MIYFLIFIGLCAAGLVRFIFSSDRKSRQTRHSASKPQYYHQARRHDPLRHNQARPLNKDMWGNRRQHAAEEVRGSYSLTARKIVFDSETEAGTQIEEGAETEVLSMTEVKYTPTDLYKTSKMQR